MAPNLESKISGSQKCKGNSKQVIMNRSGNEAACRDIVSRHKPLGVGVVMVS